MRGEVLLTKRKLTRAARFERMFKVLEYLKKNTDSENPTTQAKMRRVEAMSEYIGDKETFNRLIKDMARTMNSGEHGYKKESEWKLYFNDFKKYYGDNNSELDGEESFDNDEDYGDYIDNTMHIEDLYYKRTFSYDEINYLIESVLSSRTIDTKTAQQLIKKIEDNLTTKFYKKGPKKICKVQEPELADRVLLKENLLTIQRAIDNNVQISFRFNGYTYDKKLEPVREWEDVVSPYYIVASGGRYYLLACKENFHKEGLPRNMSIWRIDLITDVNIPGVNEKLDILGKKRTPKNKVENLPLQWSDDFQLKHLNMSFDRPKLITLRINSGNIEGYKSKSSKPDYTFLYDWFGKNFKYIKSETEAPYNDIIQVECSPYAMVNWAMQYSDRVEIIEPKEIRSTVIEKIKRISEKYGME